MSSFSGRLRQAMHDKRFKAVDVARGTKISPSVISRYLSGTNNPSTDKIFAIANYLEVSSGWLLGASDGSEPSKRIQKSTTPHKDKIIEVQEELVKSLKAQLAGKDRQIAWLTKSCDTLADEVRKWEHWKASSEERHRKGREKTKKPIKLNKQKVGFLKKHKSKKYS